MDPFSRALHEGEVKLKEEVSQRCGVLLGRDGVVAFDFESTKMLGGGSAT